MKNTKKLMFYIAATLSAFHANAQSIDGTWVFERAVDYEDSTYVSKEPLNFPFQITNDQAILPAGCVVNLRQDRYYPGGPFQSLLRSGEDEAKIEKFLSIQFNFSLRKIKNYYTADINSKCNNLGSNFLMGDEKLISIQGGSLFYAFKRKKQAVTTINAPITFAELKNIKTSTLPFNLHTYTTNCLDFMQKRHGAAPQTSKKCGPRFHPYIIDRSSKDPLLKIIGAHSFIKSGANAPAGDYNNPISHNLHPVALIFPPLKGVVLVRVEDLEGADDARDTMSGVYLAIKNEKVTDQLNEGCNFDANYVCSSEDEPTQYKLTENGKFIQQRK